jgi:hypothetical protein
MNGAPGDKYCNFCDSLTHWYYECALQQFEEIVFELGQKVRPVGTAYEAVSFADRVYPDVNWKQKLDNQMWGEFWSTELTNTDRYSDMRGPEDWYDEEC